MGTKKSLFLKQDFNKSMSEKGSFPLGLDFFSYFVHELKTPLTHLKLQVDHLRKDPSLTKQKIDEMEQALQNVFKFIEDSLDIQNLENRPSLQLKWTSLRSIIHKTEQKLAPQMKQKEIQLFLHLKEDFEVNVDPLWMEVAVDNLLLNAIQHSPQKSTIEVEVNTTSDKELKVSIVDQGEGVCENKKDEVFKCFHLHRKPRGLFKGTGLGTFIAKSIVECHSGKIGFENRNDSHMTGCAFYFILPQFKKVLFQEAS